MNKTKISIYPFFAVKDGNRDKDVIKGHEILNDLFKSISDIQLELENNVELYYPFDLNISDRNGPHVFRYGKVNKNKNKNFKDAMSKILKRESNPLNKSDVAVFYLTGHGNTNRGEYNFVIDIGEGDNRFIKGKDIYNFVLEINKLGISTVLVIDTCYDVKNSELGTMIMHGPKPTRAQGFKDLDRIFKRTKVDNIKSENDLNKLIKKLEVEKSNKSHKAAIRNNIELRIKAIEEIKREANQVYHIKGFKKSGRNPNINFDENLKKPNIIFSMNNKVYETSLGFRYGAQVIAGFLRTHANISLITFFKILKIFLEESTSPDYNTYSRNLPPYKPYMDIYLPKGYDQNAYLDFRMIPYKKKEK